MHRGLCSSTSWVTTDWSAVKLLERLGRCRISTREGDSASDAILEVQPVLTLPLSGRESCQLPVNERERRRQVPAIGVLLLTTNWRA